MKKTFWQKLITLGVIIGVMGAGNVVPVSANNNTPGATGTTQKANRKSVLGMVPWDYGVDLDGISNAADPQEELKVQIMKIAFNILKDVTVIAAYLVLGYVIYGGYLYLVSAGDAGKVMQGKKTLLSAFIGLAIVMLSNVIFTTIRFALMANGGKMTGGLPDVDPTAMVLNSIQWVIGFAGAVAAIFIVYGGICYITSAGDAGKVVKAKNVILYAVIGLMIVGLAEAITAFVGRSISSSVAVEIIKEIITNKGVII